MRLAPPTRESALRDALAAARRAFVFVVVFSAGVNLLILTAPVYMLEIYDRVIISRSTETLIFLTLIAGAALMVLGALDIVRNLVLIRVGSWLERRLSADVLAASVGAALQRAGGSSIQGLRDLLSIRSFLASPAIFPIFDAPWAPVFLALVFFIHPVLGCVALAGTVVLFGLALANELTTRTVLERSGAKSMQALNRAETAVRNADVIEAMGLLPNLVRAWHRHSSEASQLQASAAARNASILATSKVLRLGLQVGLLGCGAYLVIHSEISAGAMIAASILAARALAPIENAIGGWRTAVQTRTAYRRLQALLKTMPARTEAMPLPAPSGTLRVEGVTFVYPGASEPMLSGIGFGLMPGETLGLVGPSAAGKTTLARLLVGNLKPRIGHVRLDGMDVAEWASEDRGQHMGYLPQDVELFAGTVRENIARMGEGDSDAIVTAAQAAGVHELILRLPSGYETEIGSGGALLSGGQRQRIGLARAFFGNPRFVVLDEPSASLDQVGEQALVEAIRHLKENGTTVVMITHQPRMLHLMDKVLVLSAGQIQHFGSKEEVLPKIMAVPQGQRVVGVNG